MFWIENLFPQPEGPMVGCLPQAFPLQLDMQFALFVPPLALLTYKLNKKASLILSAIIILVSFIINFSLTWVFDFKIGLLHHSNFLFIQIMLMKPWTHLHAFGLGTIMALFYRDLQLYRREKSVEYREYKFPFIYKLHTNAWYQKGSIPLGMSILVAILAFSGPNQ